MNKAQKWIAEKILGIKALSPANPATAMMPVDGPGRFIEIGGTVTWIGDKLSSYIKDGYGKNDIIYAGVNLVMDKVKVAPWALYKVVDESSLKKYRAILSKKDFQPKDFAEARKLRTKAIEPMTNYDARTGKLNDLLDWPNEYGTWNDSVGEGVGWKMIAGNEMMWGNLLPGGANKGIPQEIFHSPAQFTKVKATRGFPQRITGWYLETEAKNFTKEEILHTKLWNPDYDVMGSALYGMSPLKAAASTLTRNNAAKKAGAVQLDNNGAAGIVYVDDALVPANGRDAQRDVVKRGWHNEYTGADNFGKIAFSGYKMGYVQVGTALKDMSLTDLEEIDLRRLFNIWGIPSQLGNDPNNKTFNSLVEAEKALTTRCALPHLINKRDHFNRKLQTDWGFKGANVYVDFDMSVYSELQGNQKEKWEWVSKLPVSSAYKLEMMDLDVPEDPMMDEILIDGNLVPLRDIVNNLSDDQMNQIDDELNKAGLRDYLKAVK